MKPHSVHRQITAYQSASGDSLAHLIRSLKKSVGQRLIREFGQCLPVVLIRRALDDAAEAAQGTGFPHLFFPELAEEKVRLVSAGLCKEQAPAEWLRSAV